MRRKLRHILALVAVDSTFGVLRPTLNAGSYSWQFVPVAGGTFTDAGSGACH